MTVPPNSRAFSFDTVFDDVGGYTPTLRPGRSLTPPEVEQVRAGVPRRREEPIEVEFYARELPVAGVLELQHPFQRWVPLRFRRRGGH